MPWQPKRKFTPVGLGSAFSAQSEQDIEKSATNSKPLEGLALTEGTVVGGPARVTQLPLPRHGRRRQRPRYRLRHPLRLAALVIMAAVLASGAYWGVSRLAAAFRIAPGAAPAAAATGAGAAAPPAGTAAPGRAPARPGDEIPVSAPATAVRVPAEHIAWVLLLGVDRAATDGGRADTMILSRINTTERTVDLVQFPAHTRVALDGGAAGALGTAYTQGGAEGARHALEQLLGEQIAHYMVADPAAFSRAVDIIGGVTLHVEQPMHGMDPLLQLSIGLDQGTQLLDGGQALQYARFRLPDTGEQDEEVQRSLRQMQVLQMLAAQSLTPGAWAKMPQLLALVTQHVQTDMDAARQLELAEALYSARDRVSMRVAPGETVAGPGGPVYVVSRERLDRLLRSFSK